VIAGVAGGDAHTWQRHDPAIFLRSAHPLMGRRTRASVMFPGTDKGAIAAGGPGAAPSPALAGEDAASGIRKHPGSIC